MKNKLITSLVVMFVSLGIAVYRSFDAPLSDHDIIVWTDFYNEIECGGGPQLADPYI